MDRPRTIRRNWYISPGTVFLQTNFPLRKVTSMAKASVGGLDLKAIRTMLTAAERRVFDSSVGRELVAAGREQLQAAISQARTLRDKWRDLYAQQTRTTKRTAKAGTPANDRSREKSELFAGALVRLEARLAEVGMAMKSAVKKAGKAATAAATSAQKVVATPATRKGANPKAARPAPKKVRTAAHRATRAGVRSELKLAVGAVNAKKGKAKR